MESSPYDAPADDQLTDGRISTASSNLTKAVWD
jgi:hypothetical protein